MRCETFLGVVAVTLALGTPVYLAGCNRTKNSRKVRVWDRYGPYSADPMEFDDSIHHLVFRSVLAPLVSQYKAGEYVGVIAEKWSVSADQREWKFKIRTGLRFENGAEITPEAVIRSLTRVAFLLKKKNSHTGFVELLLGYEHLKSSQDRIEGLSETPGGAVMFRFEKPVGRLLDFLSFGLYSIVYPGDFDSVSGKWLDPKKVTASGHYRIRKWNDKVFELELRRDFLPDIRHPRPIEEIEVVHDPSLRARSDIVAAFSADTAPNEKYHFYGGAVSGISYIICRSWRISSSPCYRLDERRRIRDAFYRAMIQEGAPATYSFFPTVMKGISAFTLGADSSEHTLAGRSLRYRYSDRESKYAQSFNKSVERIQKTLGMRVERKDPSLDTVMKEYDPDLPEYSADLYLLPSNITVDDPEADIRFMFLSKEGIRLPDTDGRIHEELKKSNLDPQKINRIIWEQAVVWPVQHFSAGLWTRDDLDFSEINMILPPTDFSWIGFKE